MIDPRDITVCLITKDATYPRAIENALNSVGFAEKKVKSYCDSPHRKHELFQQVTTPYIYYQDDDCLAPVSELLSQADPDIITCAMKQFHIDKYSQSRIALLGWGCVFPKSIIDVLNIYTHEYGCDVLYKRETERIMTWLSYPQKRIAFEACEVGKCMIAEPHIHDLPSAWAADRLSMQPGHYDYIPMVEERCAALGVRV